VRKTRVWLAVDVATVAGCTSIHQPTTAASRASPSSSVPRLSSFPPAVSAKGPSPSTQVAEALPACSATAILTPPARPVRRPVRATPRLLPCR
jgi:hypothetical protein